MNTTTQAGREISRVVRAAAGVRGEGIPLEIRDDASAPRVEGRSWHYTTAAGTPVRHPNAYKRVAKSATLVYHGSTRRVVVGRDWLFDRGLVRVPVARG